MAKLIERLAERASKNAREKGQGRAAFLALKTEIQEALDAGWNAKEVWTLLTEEGKIAISYSVFLRYIKANNMRGKVSSEAPPPPSERPPVTDPNKAGAPDQQPRGASPTPATGSSFQLSSKPDKESLV